MVSVGSLCNITVCAAGAGNQDDIDKVLSPKGLLEYIKNLFTFGGVRRDNKELYDKVNNDITRLINSTEVRDECSRTGVIVLDDIQGYKVTFTLPGNNNENGMVIVTVSHGRDYEIGKIPVDKFKFSLTELMRSGIDELEWDDYTDGGDYNSLRICNSRYDFVDSAIDEAPNFLDIDDVNSIIQEGGIFSVSSEDAPVQTF